MALSAKKNTNRLVNAQVGQIVYRAGKSMLQELDMLADVNLDRELIRSIENMVKVAEKTVRKNS